MKKEELPLRNYLQPIFKMVKIVKSSEHPEKMKIIEDVKEILTNYDSKKIDSLMLDKFFDEIIEDDSEKVN